MQSQYADVLIHIDEELDDDNIHSLERGLADVEGVACACVPESTRHLMLVDYDPNSVSAATVLNQVTRFGVHAELIGL